MAKIDGNLFRVKLGFAAIGGTTSCSFQISKDTQDTTNQDSAGNTEYHNYSGKLSVTGTFDGFYDPDNVLNAEELIDRIVNNSGFATIQVGNVASGTYYEFTGLFSNVSIDAKNDSVPTIKGDFASSGVVSKKSTSATAPELLSGEAYIATSFILDFDVDMIDPAALLSDFSARTDTGNIILSSISRNPVVLWEYIVNTTTPMLSTDTIYVSILSGNVRSVAGGILQAVTDLQITNSI